MPTPEEIAAQEAADKKAADAAAALVNKGKAKPEEEDIVKLQPAAYNALLDRLDELEGLALSKGTPKNLDDLANEGTKKGERKPLSEDDLNEMKPKEIINLVVQHINETQINPLLVKLEEMTVKQEIRELTRDGKNKDFFELKEEIYQVASRNPQLSLEEALILARQRKGYSPDGKKPEGDEDDPSKKKDLLRSLPSRRVIGGEKPGASRSSASDTEPETRKDAIHLAFADMKKAGKL
jgi:hypothetical protein